jgi:hypothetical protein
LGEKPEVIKIEEMDMQGVHPLKSSKKFKWLAAEAPKSELPAALTQEGSESEAKVVTI